MGKGKGVESSWELADDELENGDEDEEEDEVTKVLVVDKELRLGLGGRGG